MTNKSMVVGASEDDARVRLLALKVLRASVGGDQVLINAADIPDALQGLLALSSDLLGRYWADVQHAGNPMKSGLAWLDFEIRKAEDRAR